MAKLNLDHLSTRQLLRELIYRGETEEGSPRAGANMAGYASHLMGVLPDEILDRQPADKKTAKRIGAR